MSEDQQPGPDGDEPVRPTDRRLLLGALVAALVLGGGGMLLLSGGEEPVAAEAVAAVPRAALGATTEPPPPTASPAASPVVGHAHPQNPFKPRIVVASEAAPPPDGLPVPTGAPTQDPPGEQPTTPVEDPPATAPAPSTPAPTAPPSSTPPTSAARVLTLLRVTGDAPELVAVFEVDGERVRVPDEGPFGPDGRLRLHELQQDEAGEWVAVVSVDGGVPTDLVQGASRAF